MKYSFFFDSFRSFLADCPVERLDPRANYVFLSDLHMGNGTSRDDLARNRQLITGMLRSWYLSRKYVLILNGDIEDLSKFELPEIQQAWPELYALFDSFAAEGNLRKIIGNHDLTLLVEDGYPFPLVPGLVLTDGNDSICAFHGHQASNLYMKYDKIIDFLIRYLVKPLHIKNTGLLKKPKRRYAKERRIYRAARNLRLLAITGHTHRPLFESLSKFDNIRFSVEELLSEYSEAESGRREQIEEEVTMLREEMTRLIANKGNDKTTESLYGDGAFLVPCLFNSGCATGRHGITTIEITGGRISLVYWTKTENTRPYITSEALASENLGDGLFRYTLQSDSLETVFARIRLLGGESPDPND